MTSSGSRICISLASAAPELELASASTTLRAGRALSPPANVPIRYLGRMASACGLWPTSCAAGVRRAGQARAAARQASSSGAACLKIDRRILACDRQHHLAATGVLIQVGSDVIHLAEG